MKILLTGGGSGGHFYPIIAVAQALNKLIKENKLVHVELFYMAPQPYDKRVLYENNLQYIKGSAGKARRYFSLLNFVDFFKNIWGAFSAIITLYRIYPDVVFGKGGYVSFPALFAARFLRIPVIIHESDSAPGRVNKWAGKFARKIALSYPEAASFFPQKKIALTGNPIRQDIIHADKQGAHEFLQLEPNIPVVLVLGGSQGSQIINENLADALPKLVEKYQVVHQTGELNFKPMVDTAKVVLQKSQFKDRYKAFDHMNSLTLRMAAGVADVIVSRAGSTIFEIAVWGIPSILIPITDSNGDHQRKNAYSYARTGAAEVIEENNLTDNILVSEITRIITDTTLRETMKKAALAFGHTNAAELIAGELISIGLEHEK